MRASEHYKPIAVVLLVFVAIRRERHKNVLIFQAKGRHIQFNLLVLQLCLLFYIFSSSLSSVVMLIFSQAFTSFACTILKSTFE